MLPMLFGISAASAYATEDRSSPFAYSIKSSPFLPRIRFKIRTSVRAMSPMVLIPNSESRALPDLPTKSMSEAGSGHTTFFEIVLCYNCCGVGLFHVGAEFCKHLVKAYAYRNRNAEFIADFFTYFVCDCRAVSKAPCASRNVKPAFVRSGSLLPDPYSRNISCLQPLNIRGTA